VKRVRYAIAVTTLLSADFLLSCAVQGEQMPAPTNSYPSVPAIKSPPTPILAVADPVASSPSPDPFSSRQSDEDLKLITGDGRVHPIRILFWDSFKIRVANDAELVRADNKLGFVQLIQEKSVLHDLASVISQYTLAYIINPAADSLSEEELNRKEVEEEGMTGADVPNDGSWAEIGIEGYTDVKIIGLYKQLQSKYYIRGIQVVGTPP